MMMTALAALMAVLALPQPAHAWRYGRGFDAGGPGGYAWAPAPQVVFPFQRPHRDYRYSIPPGAPLSFDDPGSGVTYCWSQTTGFYFVCAYAPPSAISIGPVLPPPPSLVPPVSEPTAPPASGVLLFRLPRGTAVTVNGVPISLSNGLGIHALPPGRYLVVLHVVRQGNRTHGRRALAQDLYGNSNRHRPDRAIVSARNDQPPSDTSARREHNTRCALADGLSGTPESDLGVLRHRRES